MARANLPIMKGMCCRANTERGRRVRYDSVQTVCVCLLFVEITVYIRRRNEKIWTNNCMAHSAKPPRAFRSIDWCWVCRSRWEVLRIIVLGFFMIGIKRRSLYWSAWGSETVICFALGLLVGAWFAAPPGGWIIASASKHWLFKATLVVSLAPRTSPVEGELWQLRNGLPFDLPCSF